MVVVPQEVGQRAYALAHEMILNLSTRRQARAAEISRARHLAFGALRRIYPAVRIADIARAVGYEECEVSRAATRYIAMRCQQRKAASELRGHWHDDDLEAALMLRLAGRVLREARAPIDAPPLPPAPQRGVAFHRGFWRSRVVVEIFERPRVAAVSGGRE